MNIKAVLKKSRILKRGLGTFSTLSYVKGSEMKNFINDSTGEVLLKMAQKYPTKVSLYSFEQNKQLTYEQITKLAVKLALGLKRQFQLEPKDRVGVYSLNRWEWYVLQLAAALADVILVNINPSYRSDQLAYTIDKVRIKVLFVSDSYKNSNYINILRQTVRQLNDPSVNPYHLRSRKFQQLLSVVRFNNQNDYSRINGFINFTDLLHEPFSLQKLPQAPDKMDAANIQFTSGTTGRPKAATLSHYNILNNGLMIGQRCGYTQKDNICIPVPLYHCFGMVMGNLAGLTRGGSLTYVCQGFDPKKTLEAINKYKCTSLYGVPTMFNEYLRVFQGNQSKYNISSLRTGIIAGSLAPEALMNKILNVLKIKDITNCYGMTETSPVTFQTSPTDTFVNKTTTVGTILNGLEAKIIDSNGNTCPIGTPGEFLVKGWAVMQGYWEDPGANQRSIQDGWMKSGDLGVINKEGFLTIVGRSKDMIIRGGQNIYPKEIQEFLNNRLHNDVIDVQVVGVLDEKFGEEIVAIVKVKDLQNNRLTNKDVYSACKDHIAHYKIPRYVMFVTEYPLTVTGKIQKFILRNQMQDMKKRGDLQKFSIK